MRQLLPIGLILIAGLALVLLFGGGDGPVALTDNPDVDEPRTSRNVNTVQGDLLRDGTADGRSVVAIGDATSDQPTSSWAVRVVGRVVDTGGVGIGGAEVLVRTQPDMFAMFGRGNRGGGRNFDWRRMQRERESTGDSIATTDGEGYYAFTTSVPDEQTLEIAARHTAHAPASSRVDLDAYDDVRGEVAVRDLVLDTGLVIRGIVVDSAGQPIARASVEAARGGRGRFGGGSFAAALVDNALSDDSGHFEISGVPPGEWRVAADATGFLEASSRQFELESDGPNEDVRIELSAGAPFAGIVIDSRGRPIADARVSIEAASQDVGREDWRRRMMGRRAIEATSGTDGTFVFDAVPMGEIEIEVNHDKFLTLERDGVDASVTPEVELELADRLRIQGIVLDAASGQPIESFGIAARRIDTNREWGRGGRGGRRGDRTDSDDRSGQEVESERDLYFKERIGGAGMVAGETPEPTRHQDGRFELADLLPGRYALDVDAPGHVRIAAEIVELDAATRLVETTLHLPRGTVVRGVVLDAVDQRPVHRATVELSLAEPTITPDATEPGEDRDDRRRQMRSMMRGDQGTRIARVATDREGRFELPPVLPGRFTIRVSRRGYSQLENTDFFVNDHGTQEVELELSAGAQAFGRVLDFTPDARLEVAFTNVANGESRSTRVDADDGSYELDGLEPGGYFVEVREPGERDAGGGGRRGGRGGARGGFTARLQAMIGRPPHLTLGPAERRQYDVTSTPSDVGTVAGTVFENGRPSGGFEISLHRLDDSNTAEGRDDLVARIAQRMTRSRVDDDGRFEIDDVLPGTYRLEVGRNSGRGRGGSGGTLHTEQIVVTPGATFDLDVAFTTATLTFRVSTAAGGDIPRQAQLGLVSSVDATDTPTDEWRRADSYQRVRLTDETVEVALAPGAYRYHVSGLGIKTVVGDVRVGAGTTSVDLTIAEQTAAEFIAESDTDGDGKLSSEELPRAMQRMMEMLDADSDGFATATELDAFRSTLAERSSNRANRDANRPVGTGRSNAVRGPGGGRR